MTGVEIAHCNAMIDAVLTGYYELCATTVGVACAPTRTFGKKDTLNLDAIPEHDISKQLQKFDSHAIVITEEAGARERFRYNDLRDPKRFRTIFICDPTDNSKGLQMFLEGHKECRRVQDVLTQESAISEWEKLYGAPTAITGASSAITCLMHGVPICSVMVNYISRELFVACSAGIFRMNLPDAFVDMTFELICKRGEQLYFSATDRHDFLEMTRFVTFMGKPGYRENLIESKIIPDADLEQSLYCGRSEAAGPMRALYLSELQANTGPRIGFILANGEKIGEWIHWLPFVRFARTRLDNSGHALLLFEICHERPFTKDGILMAAPPAYSIFRPSEEKSAYMVIDVGKFADYSNPSKVRASLIVTSCENIWATGVVERCGYRPITFEPPSE